MKTEASIRSARTQDMAACANIVKDWIDATDWMPRLQSREALVQHYNTVVFRERKTFVVEANSQIVGFFALGADQTVTALYVRDGFRGQGLGHLMLQRAGRECGDRLQLWVFQKNTSAVQFYQHEGFVTINSTDGDNDEGLPDYLLEWQAAVI